MKKINYGLIVSDFDGTLITDGQEIPDEVKSAIAEYVTCGGIFAVCTGRMMRSILPRVREIGLKGLVIANQGCVIADIESGEIIKNVAIPYTETAEICKEIAKLGYRVNVYNDENIYTDIPKENSYLKKYEEIISVETKHVENTAEFVLKNKLNCQKVACLVAESERNDLYNKLCDKFGNRFDVTCSAKVLVEVSPFGETKGKAVEYLCSHFNIPLSKSVACGDNLNDTSMIKTAGVGVAVGNSDELLKAEADFVSVSNNEGALAQIIKKFGFA